MGFLFLISQHKTETKSEMEKPRLDQQHPFVFFNLFGFTFQAFPKIIINVGDKGKLIWIYLETLKTVSQGQQNCGMILKYTQAQEILGKTIFMRTERQRKKKNKIENSPVFLWIPGKLCLSDYTPVTVGKGLRGVLFAEKKISMYKAQ